MEKVTIKVIRAFYRNGTVLKVGTIVKEVPFNEAMGYVGNRKAELVAEVKPADSPKAPASNVHSDEKKKEEKK